VGAGFSTVTPSGGSVNATSVAQAVWSYSPRSLTDIQSLTAAIQNNNPGALPSYSDLQYVPVPYFVAQVSLTQVAVFIDNAIRNYNLAGAFANFISNNPYNLWNTNFVANIAINPYLSNTSLNLLITSGDMAPNAAQFLLYYLAQNYYYNRWIYTITANAPSSLTFSTNATLSTNVLIAQNITVASGVTVTCGTTTCFFIAQSFNNQGTIVNPYGAIGGSNPGSYIGVGGTGGGGVVVIALTAVPGTINIAGSPGGVGASGATASVGGGGGGAGVFYVVRGVTVPVGGSGAGSYAGRAGVNGAGGGGSGSFYGGGGGPATVYSFANTNSMLTYIMWGLSDWWLINVVGKKPSSTTPLAYMYGSGGGAGAGVAVSGNAGGGGGGGGGGEAVIYGFYITSGNINAVGGTGGSSPGNGGGGGGGGLVFVFYGATSGSITANVAGGAGQSGGLAGANGTLYIAAVTVNG